MFKDELMPHLLVQIFNQPMVSYHFKKRVSKVRGTAPTVSNTIVWKWKTTIVDNPYESSF